MKSMQEYFGFWKREQIIYYLMVKWNLLSHLRGYRKKDPSGHRKTAVFTQQITLYLLWNKEGIWSYLKKHPVPETSAPP